MVRILLKPFANFREIIGIRELEIELKSNALFELLKHLSEAYDLKDKIFDGEEIREYVNISLNGRTISSQSCKETELADGDEVAIFPPVTGG
ncbi:MAG: ubiquitin-like small modifier protein 1 [Halobacteriota archaeon]|nr:ubiquitin-like small modifier protein 1 [Halobacteriota archaeon]